MSTELGDWQSYLSQTPAPDWGLPSIPYLQIGQLAYDLLQQLFGLPDPLDLLFSLFSGRPTMDATISAAKVLKSYTSPPLVLMALGAGDLVNRNIPLSSPAAAPIYGAYFAAGVYLEEAIRWSNFTPNLQALEANTLKQAQYEAANANITTPATLQAIQDTWNKNQNDSTVLDALTTLAQTTAQDPASLLAKGVATQILAQKRPATSPGPGPGPGPGPQPTPPPTLPPPPMDPGQNSDELTDALFQTNSYLYYLAANVTPAQTSPAEPSACCDLVIAWLNAITTCLFDIGKVIQQENPGPLLQEISDNIHQVAAAVTGFDTDASNAMAGLGRELCDCIGAPLKSLADTLTTLANKLTPATDLQPIIDALNKANYLADIPHELIQQSISNGVLPPEVSGILQGTGWSWSEEAHRFADLVTRKITLRDWYALEMKDVNAWQAKAIEKTKVEAAALLKNLKELYDFANEPGSKEIGTIFEKILTTSDTYFYPVVKPLIEDVKKLLTTTSGPCPPIGNTGVDGASVVAAAVGTALSAGAAAWLAAYAGIDEGEPLAKIAEYLAGAVGFEELKDVEIRPLVQHGIARQANLQALKMFRQEIVGAGEAYRLAARGIITRAKADELAGWNGLACELENPVATAAETGLQARLMVRLIETGLFSDAEIRDELTFRGMRRLSQDRMIKAAAYMASQTERNQYKAELEKLYQAGMLTDSDLVQQYDGSEQILDRAALVLGRNHMAIQIETAKALEAEYSTLFAAGLIDLATYSADLAGIPLQQWKVNNLVAVNEIKQSARLARAEAAAARALAKETAAEERKVAIANYLAGNIDAAALALALIATGLTAIQAAAWTDMAALRKTGSTRWLYNLRLSPEQAGLVKEQIAALTAQFERQFLTQAQFEAALKALGLDDTHINGLVAAAAAKITPAKARYLVPVQTG